MLHLYGKQLQRVNFLATLLHVQMKITRAFSFFKYLRLWGRFWAPPSYYSVRIKSPYRGVCSQPRVHKSRLSTCGPIPFVPHVFMACTGTTCHVWSRTNPRMSDEQLCSMLSRIVVLLFTGTTAINSLQSLRGFSVPAAKCWYSTSDSYAAVSCNILSSSLAITTLFGIGR
jgi:hypothetical protein